MSQVGSHCHQNNSTEHCSFLHCSLVWSFLKIRQCHLRNNTWGWRPVAGDCWGTCGHFRFWPSRHQDLLGTVSKWYQHGPYFPFLSQTKSCRRASKPPIYILGYDGGSDPSTIGRASRHAYRLLWSGRPWCRQAGSDGQIRVWGGDWLDKKGLRSTLNRPIPVYILHKSRMGRAILRTLGDGEKATTLRGLWCSFSWHFRCGIAALKRLLVNFQNRFSATTQRLHPMLPVLLY